MHPLRTYREAQNPPLGQDDLARRVGVARATVTRWEGGKRKIDLKHLPRVAAVTGIPPRDLRPDLHEALESAE